MENTERIIIIVTMAVVVLVALIAIVQAFLSTRNIKSTTEIVKALNANTQWQDRTEAGLKELGVANASIMEGYRQVTGMLVSAALLVNKEDAAEFFKNVQTLGVKVLDGMPNLPPPQSDPPIGNSAMKASLAKTIADHPNADG